MKHIKVTVYPDAGEERVVKKDDTFEVFVRAPAQRGEANKAVLYLLQKELPNAGQMRIVSGARSHHKIIEISE